MYVLSKNSLQSQYRPLPTPFPPPHLCVLFCSRISNGSQYPGGGEGGAGAPRQVLAPPLRMRHSCLSEPRRSSPFILESTPPPPLHTHTHSSPPTITHTKKWLFIRILVLYCSVPHKRRFIMLEASPLFAERNNNLELSFLECIINVISSCLCPSVCVEWWVWAPGTDGLGTRAARL